VDWRNDVRRDIPWLALVVALALGLRILWVIRADVVPFEGLDTYFYDQTARRLADGLGYTHPADGQPTALFPPGYSFALGGVYSITTASVAVAQGFTIVSSALVLLATYALGRVAFPDRRIALAGAAIWAVFPSQVLWASLIMPEMVFTLALVGSLTLVAAADGVSTRRRRIALLAVAGLLAGCAVLIRGQAIGVWLVIGIWLLWSRRRDAFLGTATFTTVMVLTLVPWTVRNLRELDAPVLVSTNVGWNAVIGHADQADGGFWSPAAVGTFNAYIAPNPKGEVDRNEAGVRLAWDWARHHPRDEVTLSLKKTAILWNTDDDAVYWQQIGRVPDFMGPREYDTFRHLCNVFYYVALALAGIGVAAALREKKDWGSLWLLMFLYWTAFHVLFFSENRYHYPLSPLLALATAAGLVHVWQAVDRIRAPQPARPD
jgi:hypothetical protein